MTVEDDALGSRPSAGKLTAPPKGLEGPDASKRMHDYLVNQQRRKEEYWLRKYGKVLTTPVPSKPLRPERSAVTLPPLRDRPAVRKQALSGRAPMFTAAGPIDSFPMRAPINDKRHNPNIPYHPAAPGLLPPISGTLSQQDSQAKVVSQTAPAQYSPSAQQQGLDGAGASLAGIGLEASAARLHENHSYVSNASAQTVPTRMPPYIPDGSPPGGFKGHVMHMAPNTNVVHQGHTVPEVPSYTHVGPRVVTHSKGMRDLQLELTVLKAIKAREDTLDRLKVACDKLDASLGGRVPVVLQGTDPMVRLFYRLVGQLRARTLDCVETLAAWHRRSMTAEPFMYYGSPYIQNIGLDLAFLDKQAFLRPRLQGAPAVSDPFLVNLTADSIPIEEVTAADLRRGGHRFTSEGLRIRVARKVLATYCGNYGRNSPGALGFVPAQGQAISSIDGVGFDGPGRPGSSSSLSSINENQERAYQEAVKANNEALAPFLESMPPTADNSYAIPPDPAAPETAVPQLEAESEVCNLVQGSHEVLQAEPSQLRSSGYSSPQHRMPTDASQLDIGKEAGQPDEYADEYAAEVADESEAVQAGAQAAFLEAQDEDELQQLDVLTLPADDAVAPSSQGLGQAAQCSGAVMLALSGQLDYELDDGAFIDFAIDAMVASLEEPYSLQLGSQPFTVCGWEIDTQLDGLIDSLDAAYDAGCLQTPYQPQAWQLSRPHHQQDVHLDVHVSGDNLHVSLIPSSASYPSTSIRTDQAVATSTSNEVVDEPGARPPTRQIHLQLSAVDGHVHTSVLHTARQQAPEQPQHDGGASECRPTTARVRLVLHLSGDEQVQAAVVPLNSGTVEAEQVGGVREHSWQGGPSVELLLDVSSELIHTHIKPADSGPARASNESMHHDNALSTSNDHLAAGSTSLDWGHSEPSRIKLKLDMSGDELHAHIVPPGPTDSLGLQARPSQGAPDLTSVTGEQGASDTAQLEASTTCTGGPHASVALKLFFHETGQVQATLVPAGQQPNAYQERPGTAQVELLLDISADLVHTRINTVSMSRQSMQEGRHPVADNTEDVSAPCASLGVSADIGDVIEDLVGYVEAHNGHPI